MKNFLHLLLLCFIPQLIFAQITTPVVRANFGVDADLRANYFNNLVSGGGDDWYNDGTAGTGEFVIDTTGAAAIVAAYTTNPASRMLSFSRLMKQPPFSTVNNRLLIDAVFNRDFHGKDSTVFAAGSNKNGMSPVNWTTPVAQGIPDKNDILDVFVHVRRAGPNLTDSAWMFGGISIENTTGNRYFDFELYQTDLYYDRSTLSFNNYGPDMGHTTWQFDAAGNIISPGDIIFSAEFASAGLTLVEARIWVKRTDLLITPVSFNWGGLFDGDGSGATYGYASILPKTIGTFYTGLQSGNGVWAGPFSLVRQDNSVVTNYEARQFMEFSMNLTKLGIDPATFSSNPCGSPFRRILVKSRASTSFTAELKDFVAPFRMFDFVAVDAAAFLIYFCGIMPITPINVINPISTSIYTWSTNNGNIVGPNVGTSIMVNAPGTYYVTQQLNAACPVYATDSLNILFDSVCTVLDVNFLQFNAVRLNRTLELKWKIDQNQNTSGYIIEHSLDNTAFIPLTSVPSIMKGGVTEYSHTYRLNDNSTGTIFYRIKVFTKTGEVKYSSIKAVNVNKVLPVAFVFPNPSYGKTWLNVQSTESGYAKINIYDAYGKLINSSGLIFSKGENLFVLSALMAQKAGIYIVKIKLSNVEIIQKVMLIK